MRRRRILCLRTGRPLARAGPGSPGRRRSGPDRQRLPATRGAGLRRAGRGRPWLWRQRWRVPAAAVGRTRRRLPGIRPRRGGGAAGQRRTLRATARYRARRSRRWSLPGTGLPATTSLGRPPGTAYPRTRGSHPPPRIPLRRAAPGRVTPIAEYRLGPQGASIRRSQDHGAKALEEASYGWVRCRKDRAVQGRMVGAGRQVPAHAGDRPAGCRHCGSGRMQAARSLVEPAPPECASVARTRGAFAAGLGLVDFDRPAVEGLVVEALFVYVTTAKALRKNYVPFDGPTSRMYTTLLRRIGVAGGRTPMRLSEKFSS